MYNAIGFLTVGAGLLLFGLLLRGWGLVLCWLGFSFLWLATAHVRHAHRAFGKRADGTIPLWSKLLHLPFFCYAAVVWHALRILSREPAYNRVTDLLVIGRRLLPSEISDEFTNYVDLTAEFQEPGPIRRSSGYVSFPVLDSAAPSLESLQTAVAALRPGRTYVHCAQGHGRTGVFAIAMLLSNRSVRSAEEGLLMLRKARPAVRLSATQRKCIEAMASLFEA